jgi:type II secretory pathway pseudopilin PulG
MAFFRMKLRPTIRTIPRKRRESEGGYILITLMLFVALLIIGSMVAMQTLAFEVQRDREEELVHRGVQYARAVRKYYKKFGTYPATLDSLDNTQNLRFLRKHYKDPVTNQDFKILRMTDVHMSIGPGIAGAQALGGNVPGLAGALGQNGAFGQNGALGPNAAQVASTLAAAQSALGGNSASPFSSPNLNSNAGQNPDQVGAGTNTPSNPNSPASVNDPGNGQNGQGNDPNANSPFVTASGKPAGGSAGGAPIVGVVSTSKKETIRVFAKKNHYNDWQFVYDPNSDRGGLLNAPVQPGLQQGIAAPTQNGQIGNSAAPGASNSFSNSFGGNQNAPAAPPSTGNNPEQ